MKLRKPTSPKTKRIPMGEPQGSLGNAIRTHRKQENMTLLDLAKRAGFSISYLSQIERNLLTPSIDTLRRLAEELGIPAGQLMLKDARQPNSPVAVVRRSTKATRVSGLQHPLRIVDARYAPSCVALVGRSSARLGKRSAVFP